MIRFLIFFPFYLYFQEIGPVSAPTKEMTPLDFFKKNFLSKNQNKHESRFLARRRNSCRTHHHLAKNHQSLCFFRLAWIAGVVSSIFPLFIFFFGENFYVVLYFWLILSSFQWEPTKKLKKKHLQRKFLESLRKPPRWSRMMMISEATKRSAYLLIML